SWIAVGAEYFWQLLRLFCGDVPVLLPDRRTSGWLVSGGVPGHDGWGAARPGSARVGLPDHRGSTRPDIQAPRRENSMEAIGSGRSRRSGDSAYRCEPDAGLAAETRHPSYRSGVGRSHGVV